MKLDSEQQRAFLLEMFNSMSFPGKAIELAHDTKQAVTNAQIEREWLKAQERAAQAERAALVAREAPPALGKSSVHIVGGDPHPEIVLTDHHSV